jgi:signal transduction histidine kinase
MLNAKTHIKEDAKDCGETDELSFRRKRREMLAQISASLAGSTEAMLEKMCDQLLRESQEEIQHREHLMSVASHELKMPLTCLHLLIQLLQRQLGSDRPPSREAMLELLEKARTQSGRMIRLAEDLLDRSQVKAGQLSIRREATDLVEIARSVLDCMKPGLDAAGCSVVFDAPARLPGHWDRTRLEEVVLNLLSNAVKYGRGKPVRISIECISGKSGDFKACLSVEDHGQGIAIRDQEKIFEPYERTTRGSDQPGHGLGLYIVRQIIHGHGGSIRVQSVPGRGSVFRFEIPCD